MYFLSRASPTRFHTSHFAFRRGGQKEPPWFRMNEKSLWFPTVGRVGFEPTSIALQAIAFTRLAYDPSFQNLYQVQDFSKS